MPAHGKTRALVGYHPKRNDSQTGLITCWAYMRTLFCLPLVFLISCSPSHVRNALTPDDRALGEANWLRLEKAFIDDDFTAAGALNGKPILFTANIDHTKRTTTARRLFTPTPAEIDELNARVTAKDHAKTMLQSRLERTLKIPCRLRLSRVQEREILDHSSFSSSMEVYGRLKSVSKDGIEVDPMNLGGMLSL